MTNRFFLSFLIIFALPAFADDISLLPKYGNVTKTAEQKKLDQDFIAAALKLAGTREAAGKQLVSKGFNALLGGDAEQAMRRFNQAWLLTPDDAEVAWGLGDASAALGKFSDAFSLLDTAKKKLPGNAYLLNDIGYAYLQKAIRNTKDKDSQTKDLAKANENFKSAAKADDKDDRAYFNMAIVSMYQADYPTAWKQIGEAEARGGKSIDPSFVADLTKKLPRP